MKLCKNAVVQNENSLMSCLKLMLTTNESKIVVELNAEKLGVTLLEITPLKPHLYFL